MPTQLKLFKRASRSVKRFFLGFISCILCLLLSEPFPIAFGKPKVGVMQSDIVEDSKVQISAQTATSPTDGKLPEPQVLVAEVVVQGVSGELQEIAYQAIVTKSGRVITRSQLQEDIHAIFKTGWFRNVRAAPEDTPKGVRVTFIVQLNPALRQVNIVSIPSSKSVLPATVVNDIFRSQYGDILNLQTLQAGIGKLNQWYQNNGYVLAQVLGSPNISEDGIVTLQIAEGVIDPVIESVRVQFVNSENKPTNAHGQPIAGKTLASVILQAVASKPGMVFNRAQFEQDLKRVLGLGVLQDAKLALEPGKNPQQVAVVLNVQEISGTTEKLMSKAERVNKAEADLQRARSQKDSIAEAKALRTLAEVRSDVALYQTALKLSQASNDRAGEAEALKGLAYIYNSEANLKTNNNGNNQQSIDKEKKQQAISTYQAALKIYQNLNNDTQSAIILNNIGYIFQELEDYPAASLTYRQAATLFQKLKQPFWQALTLGNLATSYREIDEIDQSLVTHQQALLLWQFLREHPNQLQSSSLLVSPKQPSDRQNQIAASWRYSSKTGSQGHIKLYIGTNDLRKGGVVDARIGEAMTLLNVGGIYQAVGDYQQALYIFKAALPLLQIPPSTIQMLVQNGSIDSSLAGELIAGVVDLGGSFVMSMFYADMGWQQQAQSHRERVLVEGRTILEKTLQKIAGANSQSPELKSLLPIMVSFLFTFTSGMANAGSELSEASFNQLITDWLIQIMPIVQQAIAKQQLPSKWQPYLPWLEVAYNYFQGEQLAKADKPQQAVDAYRQVLAQSKNLSPLNVQTLRSLFTFSYTGNVSLISEILSKGLELAEYIPHATVYNAMGKALLASGKSQEAIKAHQQAMQILQTGQERASKNNLARTQPTNALNQFLQIALAKIPDGATADTFDQLGKAYAANGQNALALESYRRALPLWRKAKKILQEADTNWEMAIVQRQQGDLVQAKTQIETAIERIESGSNIIDQLQPVVDKLVLPQKPSPYKSYINLVDYLASKQNYYGFYIDLLIQLHQQSPTSGYEELAFQASERSHARGLRAMLNRSTPQPTRPDSTNPSDKLQAIQLAQVLSSKDLQQQLLDDKTILLEYALGKEHSYLWAVTQTGLQTYTLPKRAAIEAVSREFIELMLSPSYRVGDRRRGVASPASANAVETDAAKQLSQMLLEPVAEQLGNKRLLIVSDGILHYLPFAALPKPGTTGKNQVPLLVDHEIVGLPSASMQIGLQQRRANAKAPTKTLAILADPVFSLDDRRLQHRAPDLTADVETIYQRLPGTRREANQIAALVSPSKSLIELDTAASRRIATSPELAQYRMVHFASHGILNSQNPQRSGMVLSIVDDQGALQRSLLSTADAFNLKLSADLVVLSGCTTALGKEVQGEGLIGLTGGLMYAGAKQVVAGLWNVNDDSTALLMTHFYQGMLSQGLPPVAALRSAQIKLWQSQNWQAPYYWAAFTLQGR
jgi:CHAT domain-containing protein